MITKKHYVKIAKAINENTAIGDPLESVTVVKGSLVDELCAIFEEDNPNFDRARFITACD